MSNLPLDPNLAETLIRSLPEGIVTIDESGQIMSFNRSAERITGWSGTEAMGKSINDVLPLAAGKGQFLERLSAAVIPPINAMN